MCSQGRRWFLRRQPLLTRLPLPAGPAVSPLPAPRSILVSSHGAAAFFLPANRKVGFFLPGHSIMAIASQLAFFRGEDVTLDFTQTPVEDITGWTILFTLKDTLGGTTQFAKNAAILDGPRGRWRVSILNADTNAIAVGRYVWDARRTTSGQKTTLAVGTLDLAQEITQ